MSDRDLPTRPDERTDIPVSIAVQILETVRQSAADNAATRADVAALRADVLPVVRRYDLTLEAQAKADADADAALRAARVNLAAAQATKEAEAVTASTQRAGRFDALVIEVTRPDNIKSIVKWLAVFVAGGGVSLGGGWVNNRIHPAAPAAPLIQQTTVQPPPAVQTTPNPATSTVDPTRPQESP